MFTVLFLWMILSFPSISHACTDNACLAFEWGYPLWHWANSRYLISGSLTFHMNRIALRRENILPPPRYVLCNADLCSGEPSLLNPFPVVSQNVDTIYGTIFFDITNASYKLFIPNPVDGRNFGIQFLNPYTDTTHHINQQDYPNGGTFCVLRSGVTPNTASCPPNEITKYIYLDQQYGQIVLRVYSQGINATCGNDGCDLLSGMTWTSSNEPLLVLNPQVAYKQYMADGLLNPNGCTYHYNEPICGTNANDATLDNFWQGLCKALDENPLSPNSPEANYVQSHFASFGITAAGCLRKPLFALFGNYNLDFSTLRATLKPTNSTGGYTDLVNNIMQAAISKQQWQWLPYPGAWGTDYKTRAQANYRLFAFNPTTTAVYWTAFKDSFNNLLNGAGKSFKIHFQDPIPVDNDGFWSLTLYDNTYFLVDDPARRYAIKGTSNTVIPNDIHLAQSCTTVNCVTTPAGGFNVMLRGYVPKAAFFPDGSFRLPTITQCGSATECT